MPGRSPSLESRRRRVMPKRPTSAGCGNLAGVSRTTVSFVLNDRADVKIPDETRQRVLRCRRASSAITRTRPLGSWPAGQTTCSPSSCASRLSRSPATPLLAETLRGLACGRARRRLPGDGRAARPDGPMADIRRALRAQHADGLVISGPRVDDDALLGLVRDGFPIVLQGALPDVAVAERRRRQRRRGARRGRAPDRPRPPADRLHHQRAARLHRRPGTARRLSRRACRGWPRRVAGAGRGGALRCRSGHAAMARLLARTSFDAAFVASDVVALGAIGALREAGLRVPGRRLDRRLRRHPSRRLFRPTPHHRPAAGLRARAGRRTSAPATDRRPGPPYRTLLPTELIVRASTASRGRCQPARAEPRTSDLRLVADRGARWLDLKGATKRMEDRMFRPNRVAGILAVVAIVAAACSSGGSSPAASTAASAAARRAALPAPRRRVGRGIHGSFGIGVDRSSAAASAGASTAASGGAVGGCVARTHRR